MITKNKIFEAYQLNNIILKNRIVMAPMTRSRAANKGKVATAELQGEYYKQRATAGLIITEGSQVSEEAVGYVNTPGIHTEEQVEGWKKVVDKVHKSGGRIFIQLWHVGRMSHPDFHNGELPLAPSALNPNAQSYTPDGFKDTVTPKEMTVEDIKRTVQDFKKAGENAMKAGFDGIEIHSSNGYLFHQFFNGTSNVRTDEYGGSIENRARFFFETLDALKEVVPEEKIGARFNPSLDGMFGITMDEDTIPTFEYIIKRLNDYNLAYIHLSEPFTDVSEVKYAVKEIARHFRPLYDGTLMINTGFTYETGNDVIVKGQADLVAYGKPFISNPDLVDRFMYSVPLAEWDNDTFYTPGKEGYTDYPKQELQVKL
ncbi:alkene reductase [Cellulophaga baltica]|uniref:alkene reductase n=1 Tax=Cellulophaga TaxID=104264 RepID=UPI001C069726|nr:MULTISPECIES: alkene reductase [Cellulophaga]MBU2996263.1 alkene reductase [Cellulophaga baltica]MDO6767658.1 alkene reductase [Cellulophaga sp. 1_MG-2023]